MDRDAIVGQKNRLLEELLRLSAQMQMHLMKNQMDLFDSEIDQRLRIIDEIRKIDTQLDGHPTQQDDLWTRQLEMVKKSDAEIVKILQQHRDAVVNEVMREQRAKELVIESALVETRGQQIQVRG